VFRPLTRPRAGRPRKVMSITVLQRRAMHDPGINTLRMRRQQRGLQCASFSYSTSLRRCSVFS
jgi:hypothetical protein